jgi:hypothetical protein
VGPADRVVRGGFRAAELVESAGQELGRFEFGHAVEADHLVERAVQCAFGRGAVVTDDQIDQRVIQEAEILDRIE